MSLEVPTRVLSVSPMIPSYPSPVGVIAFLDVTVDWREGGRGWVTGGVILPTQQATDSRRVTQGVEAQ